MIKKISLYIMCILYLVAGINHFIHPESYYPIIPAYLPYKDTINIVAGLAEIILAILMIFTSTRKWAVYGVIILLILFLHAHIYMVQKNGCITENVCWPEWVAWLRLFPIQFLLMWWAWWHRK